MSREERRKEAKRWEKQSIGNETTGKEKIKEKKEWGKKEKEGRGEERVEKWPCDFSLFLFIFRYHFIFILFSHYEIVDTLSLRPTQPEAL